MNTADLIAKIEAELANWHGNTRPSAEAKAKAEAEIARLMRLAVKP